MGATVTPADGYGERDAALRLVERLPGRHRITVAADFVAELRHLRAPRTSRNTQPGGAAPLTDTPRGTLATPSVSASGSLSSRASGG